jgi:hypothetical protein
VLEWLSQWEDWRGKESGAAVDTTGAHLWTMRAGKPVRLEVFSSRTKALEAAGLEE